MTKKTIKDIPITAALVAKMLHKKQILAIQEYYQESWRYLILDGAVRTGKTYVNNLLFIMELLRVKKQATAEGVKRPNYILAGVSFSTIETNVLNEIEELLGIELKATKSNRYDILGVRVLLAYTGNTRGVGAIRGATCYGAYINEGSEAHHAVFKEINNRCSKPGSRILVDTNPDVPNHYLNKDYIQKAGIPNEDGKILIRNINFKLDDNSFLTSDYVEGLKQTTPSGPFYQRSIMGEWTTGEGAVFKDFDEEVHYIDQIPYDDIDYFIGGIDWGFEHYGSMVVIGVNTKEDIFYILEAEAEQYKQVDYWITRAHHYENIYGKIVWYADSARPEYVTAFHDEWFDIHNGNKNRKGGIEKLAGLFKINKIYFNRERVAERLKEELYNFSWDPKTGVAKKEYDDILDAIRYAIYSYFIHGVQVVEELEFRGIRM